MSTAALTPLRRNDYLLLTAYCVVLFGVALTFDTSLNTHETVHCVNIQEMLRDGDWVIPHYGSRPWLERPPLPFWLTMPLVRLFGDTVSTYRLAPALMALPCVLITAWIASLWYGRAAGLLAGFCLATMREFNRYATAPECDMFLCTLVTIVLALFVHLEFQRRPSGPEESGGFLGRRPLAVLALFLVLGLTNLVKGVSFGTVLALVPIACYLLLGPRPWTLIRRYVWLPGWLLFAAIGSAWALAVYSRQPDFVELWRSDFVGRLSEGYLREPAWYYLANLPLIVFPWLIPALVGLAVTRNGVLGQGRSPERFLWLWALAPMAFLSIPQGKHHHYLLHHLTPWAILAALGMVRLWQTLPTVDWLRKPWPTLLVLVPAGEVGLSLASRQLGGLALAALIAWPLLVLACWWILTRSDVRRASVALFALMVPICWGLHVFNTLRDDRYAADREFVRTVRETVPAEEPVLVLNDHGPLNASWMLFYLERRSELLHNLTFLRAQELPEGDLYLIARRRQSGELAAYGNVQPLFTSQRTRDELQPGDRFTLFRVQRYPDLPRSSARVHFSALQATGRSSGPELP